MPTKPKTAAKTSKVQTKTVKAAKKTLKSAPQAAKLQVGDVAPDFTLDSDDVGGVTLSDFFGKKRIILYFYPKDNTPGCTRQACAFQAAAKKLAKQDAVVIGISPDSTASHAKFRQAYGLEFTLLADPDHAVAETYGVWQLKKNYGKTYMGIQRTTFVIGKDGKISHVWPKVSVDGHDEDVLAALSE